MAISIGAVSVVALTLACGAGQDSPATASATPVSVASARTERPSDATHDAAAGVSPTSGPEHLDLIEHTIATDPRIQALVGGVRYEPRDAAPSTDASGAVTGAWTHIVLSAPVSAGGPWLFLKCRGTRQSQEDVRYNNVWALSLVVSRTGAVLNWSPFVLDRFDATKEPVVYQESRETATVVLRDLVAGTEIARWRWVDIDVDGPLRADAIEKSQCPEGFSDD